MAEYRSALGKSVDMRSITSRNESVRAVGNMKVNARGDTIDGQGNVLTPATKKVNDGYQRTVSNRAANVLKPKNAAAADVQPNAIPIEELHPSELDLEDDHEAEEIEAIKAAEAQKVVIKPASEAPDFVIPEEIKKTK
jgi:hypothetical protein